MLTASFHSLLVQMLLVQTPSHLHQVQLQHQQHSGQLQQQLTLAL
jgi:hypothetical protein